MRSRSLSAVTSSSSWAWPRTMRALPLVAPTSWRARPPPPAGSADRARRAGPTSSVAIAALASAMVRPTRRAERKLLASMREEAGRPIGTSMMRFSTSPSSVTMTTSARPGPRWTNSIWRSARSGLGRHHQPGAAREPGQRIGRLFQDLGQAAADGGALAVDGLRARRRSAARPRAARGRRAGGRARSAGARPRYAGRRAGRHPPDRPSHCGWSPATAPCPAGAKSCASRPARRSRHRRRRYGGRSRASAR